MENQLTSDGQVTGYLGIPVLPSYKYGTGIPIVVTFFFNYRYTLFPLLFSLVTKLLFSRYAGITLFVTQKRRKHFF